MNPLRNRKRSRAYLIVATIILLGFSATPALGQGGTGREPANTNANRSGPSASKSRGTRSPSPAKESESTATLDETLTWIGERLATFSFWEGFAVGDSGITSGLNSLGDHSGSPSYKIDGCTVTVARSYTDRIVGERQIEIVVPFADIDPRSVVTSAYGGMGGSYGVEMRTSSPSLKLLDSYEARKLVGVSAHFTFWKQEQQKSFENAVKHAVKLCGGKPSAF